MTERYRKNGISIARDILLIISLVLSLANVVLMIVQTALDSRRANGYIRFKDNDEIPF
ncbi:MAG: hypothetical protein ACI4JJ_07115 [Huintestinicola sp.]